MKTKLSGQQFGVASIDLHDGTRLDVHMANNRGRGTNNVTLTRVPIDTERPAVTARYENYIAQTQTGGWRGYWYASKRVRESLELT